MNVGFAALQMKHDLRLSNTVYGTGAGIFFLGSALFDLPSNLMLVKVGPRRWIARIMISWGVIATCMMFVRGPISFYVLRFLLGVCEAGFFPGMILYLTYWFPSKQRAGAIAKFMTATSIAGVVGAPISGWLLNLDGLSRLHGWQWLFLVEGIPSFLMGFSVLYLLKDKPDDANWLSAEEKLWLDAELEQDRQASGAAEKHNLIDAFREPMIWLLAAICFVDQVGVYTVNLWMPLILTSFLHGTAAASSTLSAADTNRIANYCDDSVLRGGHLHRGRWLQQRPQRRASLAYRRLPDFERDRLCVGRHHALAGRGADGIHAGRSGVLEHHGAVLGAAHEHDGRSRSGRRRGHHHDDLGRGRFRGTVPHRPTARSHPRLLWRAVHDRRANAGGRGDVCSVAAAGRND